MLRKATIDIIFNMTFNCFLLILVVNAVFKRNNSNVHTEVEGKYLAGIEMSNDPNDDLVIFIRCLFPGDHHLSCCQVLQLIHLKTSSLVILVEHRTILTAESCRLQ